MSDSNAARALTARLTAVQAVTDQIGDRLYPSLLPQNPTYPAAVYDVLSGAQESAMGVDVGVSRKRIQCTVWASTFDQAAAARTEVVTAMRRFRGTSGGVVVQDTFIENDEQTQYDDELEIHAAIVDVLMVVEES